ncbi:MAG TPA: hypothetical protein VMU10_12190 [Desulfomonilia bacterium]|nr:hypothetical protein [Desulfomonilia bacterium]
MHDHETALLLFVVDENRLGALSLILQQGFLIKADTGCSLSSFLMNRLGLSPDYIREKIQTIFLDGSPVDDLDSTIIKDGSHLALSAAMPGLVGAAMRRGGFYSTLRNSITYKEAGKQLTLKEGTVHIKLFNLLMTDLGPHLLREGVLVQTSDLSIFLATRSESFWAGCRGIFLNEQPIDKDSLLKANGLAKYKMTYLIIQCSTRIIHHG